MNEDNHIEEFIESRLNEKEFTFQEGDWHAALETIETLDAEKRKRRMGIVLLFTGLFMAVGMVAGWKLNTVPSPAKVISIVAQTAPGTHEEVASQIEQVILQMMEEDCPEPIDVPERVVAFSTESTQAFLLAERNPELLSEIKEPISFQKEKLSQERLFPPAKLEISSRVGMKNIPKSIVNQSVGPIELTGLEPIQRKKKWHLEAYGGTYFYQGFENPVESSSPKIGFEGGLRISYPIARQVRLVTGLGYYQRSGINQSISTYNVSYNFVFQRQDVNLEVEKLNFLYIPIQGQLAITPRSRLMLGGGASYLLTTQSTLATTASTSLQQFQTVYTDETGYKEGFPTLSFDFQAGYIYAISKRMDLGLFYHHGLHDLTDDAFFDDQSTHKNNRLAIQLIFNLN